MQKITKRKHLLIYGCAGLGVNMLNLIVGTYLCSAIIVGGFKAEHIGLWTYTDKTLVVTSLWMVLSFAAKVIDGLIDLPMSPFIDNLKTKWGRRKPAILMGFVPMLFAYAAFLIIPDNGATIKNTIWFAIILGLFYLFYTMTMLTYYATFSEVTANEGDLLFLSNVKSVCDVVYFILGYALLPVFISLGMNIRIVALIFLPLSLTMMIPMFLLKEKPLKGKNETITENAPVKEKITIGMALSYSFKNKTLIFWMCVAAIMNVGLQLFLSGINEFFSSTGINMTFVMASSFAPVPFTMPFYNAIVKKKGLGFGYRYVLLIFSVGMSIMFFCNNAPKNILLPLAIFCGVLVSFAIGAFFSVSYTVPSFLAAEESKRIGRNISSMYFAIQGLFENHYNYSFLDYLTFHLFQLLSFDLLAFHISNMRSMI
jgi:Na+/melibiose symporter-like transporter